jgi:hypothetical protein
MQNINDRLVEICGERFPAVNIQIFDCYPELLKIEEFWFGVYFEIMFESGTYLIISQEAAEEAQGTCQTMCKDKPDFLNHFHVEEYKKGQIREPFYAWHCENEQELVSVLRTMTKELSSPSQGHAA